MRDDKDGAPRGPHGPVEGVLDRGLALRIQRARRLIRQPSSPDERSTRFPLCDQLLHGMHHLPFTAFQMCVWGTWH